jgi:spore germination protein KC
MKKISTILLTFIILINSIFAAGCWNYREIEKMSIVAGVAVDKGVNDQYQITAEIAEISGGMESKMASKTITAEGKSVFDAARNMIALSGKKLYWSHAKVLIIDKKIANEGVTNAIELFNRDAETRDEIFLLISQRESAREIFDDWRNTNDIKSFALEEMLQNQVNLSKAPLVNILNFDIESKTKGISPIIPAVNLKQIDGKTVPQIMGTAIIKKDKLAGFLNADETKDLIFIRNKIKGGILVEKLAEKDVPTVISLEIFKNKTKINPVVDGRNIQMNLNIDTTVAIDEIDGTLNFLDDEARKKFEQSAESALKKRIESLVSKMQSEYDADIFGFGAKLWEDKPLVWKNTQGNWEEVFKNVNVNVKTRVHIKNSAVLSKPLREGD